MDLLQVNVNNIQDVITERNNCLPPLLSSLDDIDHLEKLLDNVKLCTKYLSTYSISDVDQELLRHVVPAIKKCLLKVYEDNFLLSDTVGDEFVVTILKQNLQAAEGFIQIIKGVLEFLSKNSEIHLYYLNNTLASLAQIILSTFGHCKNSTDTYKQAFNVELLQLFRGTQEAHLSFLKLFETCIVIKNEPDTAEEVRALTEVLDIICNFSKILSELNIKSMCDNWKGYAAIAQKFSSFLESNIDLTLPISCLNHEVNRNLSSIENQKEIDIKVVSQVVKITAFLIKVALKISDIFWNCIEKNSTELLKFCCTVYGFPTNLYRSLDFPSEILYLIDNSIFKTIEPLLTRLLDNPLAAKIFSLEDIWPEKYPFGFVNFLNGVLRILILNKGNVMKISIDRIVNAIFHGVNLCFAEFFYDSEPLEGIFDSLVVNISASVILFDDCFGDVEKILLKNILQGHVFAALLAMEVWTLLLCNSTPEFCLTTLTNLIQKCEKLNFGPVTNRPEQSYLQCLMQRIFGILPNHTQNEFVLRNNPVRSMECWKMIQFRRFPLQQRLSIEGVCMTTMDKIEVMKRGSFTFQDVIFVAENLQALSTANFNEIGLNPSRLSAAVYGIWEFNSSVGDIAGNNVFKYFLTGLCRITGTLVQELNNKQLITVLTQLKTLSKYNSYKLQTCEFLSALSNRPKENCPTNSKLNSLITEVICENLLVDSSNVIKQNVLEVIYNFALTGKDEVVKNVLRSSKKDTEHDISNYLQRHVALTRFDKEYFTLLGNSSFQHECIQWRSESQPKSKKLRYDDRAVEGLGFGQTRKKETRSIEKQSVKPSKWCKPIEIASKAVDADENKHDGNVDEVLSNIKGEVKCLVKVLKTEKMTAKNASDIKMIANQLLSLL